MMREPFPITSKFRTVHSIGPASVEYIINSLTTDTSIFVDYGCHLGHVSFEVAMRYDCEVIAVDNFIGSHNDPLMAETIDGMPDGFRDTFDKNMASVKSHFIGSVIPMYSDQFWAKYNNASIDVIFIDSSHNKEDDWEFQSLFDLLVPGGLLIGDDYEPAFRHVSQPVDKLKLDKKAGQFTTHGNMFAMRKKL